MAFVPLWIGLGDDIPHSPSCTRKHYDEDRDHPKSSTITARIFGFGAAQAQNTEEKNTINPKRNSIVLDVDKTGLKNRKFTRENLT